MIAKLYNTTIGKKVLMALSGLVFVGFVIAHMLGNLKIFAGINPESGLYKFDEYAIALRTFGQEFLGHETFLWLARAVLLASILLHVAMALQLARINQRAKPRQAHNPEYRSASAASRTMLFGGIFILFFIVYHILHLTTGTVHSTFVEGQVYQNVYSGFRNPLVSGFYCLAMLFLALHLYHGVWSMFQTLGVDHPAWNKGIKTLAQVVSIAVFLGFIAVPLSVTFGVLPAPLKIMVGN